MNIKTVELQWINDDQKKRFEKGVEVFKTSFPEFTVSDRVLNLIADSFISAEHDNQSNCDGCIPIVLAKAIMRILRTDLDEYLYKMDKFFDDDITVLSVSDLLNFLKKH